MAKILLLEPDLVLAGSLKLYFANAKYTVYTYSDPQAAIAAADKNPPDIVITDLQLANRSAVEFLYEFRSYPEWQAIPVIVTGMLSSQDMANYAEVFDELNVSQYLYKLATSPAVLLRAVERQLLIEVK